MQWFKRHRTFTLLFFFGCTMLMLEASVVLVGAVQRQSELAAIGPQAIFAKPTYSSPIAMSQDNTLVWVVNPDDDSVSVIRTDTNAVIKKITVGDEPQGIALDPNNQFAYVASPADNTVQVIRIFNASVSAFDARIDTSVGVGGALTTGAEPWNIVSSPDGQRIFVANSGQDTITVINALNRTIIGHVDLRNSLCNDPDRSRRFQPRGLAVLQDNSRLFVTRFLSFTKPGGTQGSDIGKVGLVCRLTINTSSLNIADYAPTSAISLNPQDTGFALDANGDGIPDPTSAFPNQLQSIVIRDGHAYLPGIAASPSRPLRFNTDTHAFVNRIDNLAATEADGGALNMHLGARLPETGKPRHFFANPWALAFTNQSGAGAALVVSSGSDLLVRVNVNAAGVLAFTGGVSTTKYIDLNDPNNPATSGANAGKNPLGIVINDAGATAYVMNYVSRNVSVVDLNTNSVAKVLKTTELPPAATQDETIQVGKEMFFASRGNFNRPGGTTVSTSDRLSSEGWQTCASCHFAGQTDGVIWQFGSGPRKSVPMNGTWDPHNPNDQRVLNYSAIFDEVQDFELNIRNVSGPGPLATPIAGSVFNPNQGLLISDTGNINFAPAAVPPLLGRANGGRPQHTVTLPGSTAVIPALDALKEWVRFGIRTPNGALTTAQLTPSGGGGSPTGGLNATDVADGRRLFTQAGCQGCHGGGKWTNSVKDFTSPPAAAEVATETDTNPAGTPPDPNLGQFMPRFLRDIGSFNLNVPGSPNQIPGQLAVGAVEKDTANRDALGIDYNGDGKGAGFNPPSLLGLSVQPPYYHNGACESLLCVVADPDHRAAGLQPGQVDPLTQESEQRKLVSFLESLDAETVPTSNLRIVRHDIFFDPPTVIAGSTTQQVGANITLFGPRVPTFVPGPLKVTFYDGQPGASGTTVIGEADVAGIAADFSQVTVKVPWTVPTTLGVRRIFVVVDRTNLFVEPNEQDNTSSRGVIVRSAQPDLTPPVVSNVLINNGDAITNSPDVTIKFNATDPPSAGGAATSGVNAFCIVRYTYDSALRQWVEETCQFAPLPPANPDSTFTVATQLQPFAGVAYAFVWVRDAAGNISQQPGFDVISFVPAGDIEFFRNQVEVFRISLDPGQNASMVFTPAFGDIDVAVFQGITADAERIAVSAQNGAQPETVTFSVPAGGSRTIFQVEVRAFAPSVFRIAFTQGSGQTNGQVVIAPGKVPPTTPFVAGPPALQAAIDEPAEAVQVFLPLVAR